MTNYTLSLPAKFQRGKLLAEALEIINGERQQQYGKPENTFGIIADFWNTYLADKICSDNCITPKDVAVMMTLLKIAREANGAGKRDNLVDAAGYIGLAGDMQDAD